MFNTIENPTPQNIVDASECNWDANKNNCSGFVRPVIGEFNVTLTGTANQTSRFPIGYGSNSGARAGGTLL